MISHLEQEKRNIFTMHHTILIVQLFSFEVFPPAFR